tara:strand:- start:21 stop:209 length:189 start_codon:yes stop_codon:yes gene_type:complete
MLHSYQPIDLYPDKIGVEPVNAGYLWKFKPWYYDGRAVYWGKQYELRSEAEDAAYELKRKHS